MAYSHARLRNTLAAVRVLTGTLFLITGAHKIGSLEFVRVEFPNFLRAAVNGAAVGFYADFLAGVVWQHYSQVAVLIALTELFIGVGLLLGLAVRPISVVGMAYTVHLFLATCMAPGSDQPLWRYLENETGPIMMFALFLILGIGHAGENWGVGSLYHRHRRRKWEHRGETSPELEASQPAKLNAVAACDEDDYREIWPTARRYQANTD